MQYPKLKPTYAPPTPNLLRPFADRRRKAHSVRAPTGSLAMISKTRASL